METPEKQKLLIIDDDPDQLLIVSTILRRKCSCEVLTAKNINEGLQVFASDPGISLVISDVAMPGMSIEELIENIRKTSAVPIIIVTSAYEEKKEDLLALGASKFIPKQDLAKQLAPAVNELLLGA